MGFLALDTATGSSITSGISDVLTAAGQAVTFLTGNPLCLVFIGASLLGVGFGIFRKAKGASGGH
ncbi:MAG TPA: hypothetical protein VHO94_06395 [Oscillospiraceae bacterium]|nr:hypothetical protein [Oscillospiraceae bacterium]